MLICASGAVRILLSIASEGFAQDLLLVRESIVEILGHAVLFWLLKRELIACFVENCGCVVPHLTYGLHIRLLYNLLWSIITWRWQIGRVIQLAEVLIIFLPVIAALLHLESSPKLPGVLLRALDLKDLKERQLAHWLWATFRHHLVYIMSETWSFPWAGYRIWRYLFAIFRGLRVRLRLRTLSRHSRSSNDLRHLEIRWWFRRRCALILMLLLLTIYSIVNIESRRSSAHL